MKSGCCYSVRGILGRCVGGGFRCKPRHDRALVLVRELAGTVKKVGVCVIGVSDSWYHTWWV